MGVAHDFPDGIGQFVENRAKTMAELPPGLGKFHAPAGAGEQLHRKPVLELPDMAADGCVGDE